VVSVFTASLAKIRPIPAIIAVIAVAKSGIVVGSPSKYALRTAPTASRIAATPAKVVFLLFISKISFTSIYINEDERKEIQ